METVKKFFFRTCPKSGRIVGVNKDNLLMKVFFPLLGIAALIWFLVRVIPKPSRIDYPCQKVAAPLAFSVLSYIAGYLGMVFFFKKTKALLQKRRFSLAILSVFSGLIIALFFIGHDSVVTYASNLVQENKPPFYVPIDKPNQPVGIGKGIFPGRVVWVRDITATPWDEKDTVTRQWWDDRSTIQSKVDLMMANSLNALTGAKDNKKAWDKVFKYYNQTHGRGKKGYDPKEKIAIKINCNNAYAGYGDVDQQIDASKQTILALLRQLVNNAGVPQKNIVLYEAVRVIPDRIYVPCHAEFPDVKWADSKGDSINGRIKARWHDNVLTYSATTKCGTSIAEALYDATYLINMALLKGHVSIGVTLTAKNHYGTINKRDHSRFDPGVYHPFVDIIGSKHVGQKTILYIIDGLYGIRDVNDKVTKQWAAWNNMFKGEWLASIFMSQDPIAIDAVGYDFLRCEFGTRLGRGKGMPADTYMHEAAQADNPPSGIEYKPDGVRLTSLGVHEHWNDSTRRQYTRNINPKANKGIELFEVKN